MFWLERITSKSLNEASALKKGVITIISPTFTVTDSSSNLTLANELLSICELLLEQLVIIPPPNSNAKILKTVGTFFLLNGIIFLLLLIKILLLL